MTIELDPPPLHDALVEGEGRTATSNWDKWFRFIHEKFRADPWHDVGATGEPAFENSWANYSGYQTSFRKDAFGRVHLKGLVLDGSGVNTAIFTLPVGYRPTEHEIFEQNGYNSSAYQTFCRVDVLNTGVVRLTAWSSGTAPTGGNFVSLAGMSFSASDAGA